MQHLPLVYDLTKLPSKAYTNLTLSLSPCMLLRSNALHTNLRFICMHTKGVARTYKSNPFAHTKGDTGCFARTNLRFVTKVSHAHTKGITFSVGKGLGEHTNLRFDPLRYKSTICTSSTSITFGVHPICTCIRFV